MSRGVFWLQKRLPSIDLYQKRCACTLPVYMDSRVPPYSSTGNNQPAKRKVQVSAFASGTESGGKK